MTEYKIKDKLAIKITLPLFYGYVYKTTNLINGKIYVGLHRNREFNKNYFGSGVSLKNAIKKHGIENFRCEVIEWCFNKEELAEREIFWINELNCLDNEVGYNLHEGGGMPPISCGEEHYLYGKKLPQYIKDAISKANTGREAWNKGITAEIDNRVASGKRNGMYGVYLETWNKGLTSDEDERILAGEKHPRFGIPLSEETKGRIRQHHIEYYSIKENCPNYGKTFSQEHRNRISKTRIEKEIAKGENNPMYGKKFTQEHKSKISKALQGKRTGKDNHESIPIEAILVDGSVMTFASINLASIYFGINYWTLSSGLKDSVGEDGYYKNRKTGIKIKRLDEGSY